MNQIDNSQEKKMKHKSFLLRTDARNDFKVKKSPALDVTAIVISIVAAFFAWVLSTPL